MYLSFVKATNPKKSYLELGPGYKPNPNFENMGIWPKRLTNGKSCI